MNADPESQSDLDLTRVTQITKIEMCAKKFH